MEEDATWFDDICSMSINQIRQVVSKGQNSCLLKTTYLEAYSLISIWVDHLLSF